jgi:DNA-binding transcriptional LysR family regulator
LRTSGVPGKERPPHVVDDLKDHQCITFGGGTQARTWYFVNQAGHRHPFYAQGRVGINHSEAILNAALNGEGVALLADWLPEK